MDFICCDFKGPNICCSGCHEDHEEYGYSLSCARHPNGDMAYVCCTVKVFLDNLTASNQPWPVKEYEGYYP